MSTHRQTTAAPAIDTERLTLRGHRLEDFADYAAMWGDPEVTRYIGGRPFSEEEVWVRLLRQVGHWALLGFGYWVIRDRASGHFLGEVGFADLRRDLQPPLGDAPEAGWVLVPWAHGRGLASEAVRAALEWSEVQLGARRTVCIIDPENAASLRVAAKHGYRETHRTTYKGTPTVVFVRDV